MLFYQAAASSILSPKSSVLLSGELTPITNNLFGSASVKRKTVVEIPEEMLDAFEQIENNNVERSALFCNILVLKRRVFVEKNQNYIDVSLI